MRRTHWSFAHRVAGLATAAFLTLAGVTGAIIAWNNELDRLLNPEVLTANGAHDDARVDRWIDAAETRWPNARVFYVTLPHDEGDVARLYVTGVSGVDEVFVDPSTGAIKGSRLRGTFPTRRLEIMPFVYALHDSLCAGVLGMRLMGIVGIIWLLDTFVGLRLAWPPWTLRGVRRALGVKLGAHPARVTYDVHRAGGLWVWPLLSVMAFTGVAMSLHAELFEPILRYFGASAEVIDGQPVVSAPERSQVASAIAAAREAMASAGDVSAAVGGVRIAHDKGCIAVGFHARDDVMRDHPGTFVTVSDATREVLDIRYAGGRTAADMVHDWQFPLHSGKAFGITGRIIVTVLGLLVATLAVTGVAVWARKTRFRWRGIAGTLVPALHQRRSAPR